VPLATLLNNNSFTWIPTIDHSFQALKEVMCTTLVLSVLNFTNNFFLECDSFERGIGAILMKDGQTLAFTRKQLSQQHLGQLIYEKGLFSILHAMDLLPQVFSGATSFILGETKMGD
jgi:hypothetical protein